MNEELPFGWSVQSLRQLAARLIDGSHNPPARQTEGLPMLSAQNIRAGVLSFDDARLIYSEDFDREERRTRVKPGDVLLTIVGSIGRSAVVPDHVPKFTLQRSVAVVSPRGVDPKFLHYQFAAPSSQRHFEENARGTAQKGIYLGALGDLPVQLPPLAEQQRIVSRIEELFSEIDDGERALERAGRLVERYRQSVLKAAVMGTLVPSGRVDGELPAGWQLRSLADLSAEKPSSGISVKGSDSPPGVAALRLNAITEAGFNYDARRFIPISREKAEKLAIQAGDFFVSRANGSLQLVGRGVLATQPPCLTVFPDTMIRYRLGQSDALNRWVAMAWGSGWVRRQIEVRAKTTAGIYKISQTDIAEITFPVPPTEAEMLRAVDAVDRQSAAWRSLADDLTRRRREAAALRQSVLKAAFSGQLVPQDPSDEPAAALLARIASQAAPAAVAPAVARRRSRPAGQRPAKAGPSIVS